MQPLLLHTSSVPSLGLDRIQTFGKFMFDSGFSECSAGSLPSSPASKRPWKAVRSGKFPQRWSQTLSPEPVASPPPVPCNDVTFQHDGLWQTTSQPGHGQGRAIFNPSLELFSPQEFEEWAEKQRWGLEETWNLSSPKQESFSQVGFCCGRVS